MDIQFILEMDQLRSSKKVKQLVTYFSSQGNQQPSYQQVIPKGKVGRLVAFYQRSSKKMEYGPVERKVKIQLKTEPACEPAKITEPVKETVTNEPEAVPLKLESPPVQPPKPNTLNKVVARWQPKVSKHCCVVNKPSTPSKTVNKQSTPSKTTVLARVNIKWQPNVKKHNCCGSKLTESKPTGPKSITLPPKKTPITKKLTSEVTSQALVKLCSSPMVPMKKKLISNHQRSS
jgi:hypothetical protein